MFGTYDTNKETLQRIRNICGIDENIQMWVAQTRSRSLHKSSIAQENDSCENNGQNDGSCTFVVKIMGTTLLWKLPKTIFINELFIMKL